MLLLIFFNVNFYLFLALPGLCCCPGFSLVVERGATLCSKSFSLQGLLLLWSTGFRAGRLQ